MKKIFKIVAISILGVILFRGFIYRFIITYNEIGVRKEIKITNEKLINEIETITKDKEVDIEQIINTANLITSETLDFSDNEVSRSPNKMIKTNQANCIGYSTMFNSVANYLINREGLENKIEARHLIGSLNCLGINLHQFFEGSFFQDHDFNQVKNLETGEIFSIDPSVNDYFWIDKISFNKD